MSDIRDRITSIQDTLATEDMSPDLARRSLVQLTALLGVVTDDQRADDLAYKRVLLACMNDEGAAAKGRIKAEATDEYQQARASKDLRDQVLEMVRSCKAYLRSLDEEMRLSR